MFEFVLSKPVGAYPSSRIWLEFPLIDELGPLFEAGLGAYSQSGDSVGCWFDDAHDIKPASADAYLGCRLIKSPAGANPPLSETVATYVELVNFGGIAVGGRVKVFVAKIKMPSAQLPGNTNTRLTAQIGVLVFDQDQSTLQKTYTHYESANVLLNIRRDQGRP